MYINDTLLRLLKMKWLSLKHNTFFFRPTSEVGYVMDNFIKTPLLSKQLDLGSL